MGENIYVCVLACSLPKIVNTLCFIFMANYERKKSMTVDVISTLVHAPWKELKGFSIYLVIGIYILYKILFIFFYIIQVFIIMTDKTFRL